jgi:hypothetical protein
LDERKDQNRPVPNPSELFQEWRTANRQAQALEKSVVRRSMDSIEGLCEAPTDLEHESAHVLRATADDLFQLAMDEMAKQAKANRR